MGKISIFNISLVSAEANKEMDDFMRLVYSHNNI